MEIRIQDQKISTDIIILLNEFRENMYTNTILSAAEIEIKIIFVF